MNLKNSLKMKDKIFISSIFLSFFWSILTSKFNGNFNRFIISFIVFNILYILLAKTIKFNDISNSNRVCFVFVSLVGWIIGTQLIWRKNDL